MSIRAQTTASGLRTVGGRKELGQCDISLVAELWVPRASFAPTHYHLQVQLSTTASPINLTIGEPMLV